MRHSIFSIVVAAWFIFAPAAMAHVAVQPDTVGVAQRQTFHVSVPNEKDNPTVGLRLVVPTGLQSVTPNVKPGWKIEVKKTGEGEEAVVTEITWSEGTIPAGLRDDFYFRAQAPADIGELIWKAYQTYQDGSVVAWDQDPNATSSHSDEDPHAAGPYSVTTVIDDLADSETVTTVSDDTERMSIILGWSALGIAIISLLITLTKRSK